MKKYSMMFIVVLSTSLLYSQTISSKSFEKYFSFVKEIKFDSKIILGTISSISINNNNDILLTDGIGKSVYLFNSQGNIIKKLETDECSPGINWRPLKSYFNARGDIYAMNIGYPWGFMFGRKGECIGKMNEKFTGARVIDFFSDGSIVGYKCGPDGNFLQMMDTKGKEIKKYNVFPDEYKNLIRRFNKGNFFIGENDNIYFITPIEPVIYIFNKQFKLIKKTYFKPYFFAKVDRDISADPAELIKEFGKVSDGKSYVCSIDLLSKNKLLMQVYSNKKYKLWIMDLKSEKVFNEEIVLDEQPLYIKNNMVYFYYQPKADTKGNISNPSLMVYKLKE